MTTGAVKVCTSGSWALNAGGGWTCPWIDVHTVVFSKQFCIDDGRETSEETMAGLEIKTVLVLLVAPFSGLLLPLIRAIDNKLGGALGLTWMILFLSLMSTMEITQTGDPDTFSKLFVANFRILRSMWQFIRVVRVIAEFFSLTFNASIKQPYSMILKPVCIHGGVGFVRDVDLHVAVASHITGQGT
jgi:hypothetical protein